jgi:pyrroline-5-carboxylate reductase
MTDGDGAAPVNTATQITFLGGGNMARALLHGLLRRGRTPSQLRVGEPVESQRALLQRELGVAALADNAAALEGAAVVVLAVKPQQLLGLLGELGDALRRQRPLLLSIAAGLRLADLSAACPGLPIVRAMPNRPALVGAGVTGLYAGMDVPAAARTQATEIMDAVGRSVWVRRETDLDIVTALSGSGPAYFFLLAEQLAAAAVAQGLDRATADLLATQTLRGTGIMCDGTATLAQQRQAVTSRGGTTEAALAALAAGGFDTLIAAAIEAATRRSAELAAQFGRPGNGAA